jgi:hypothetical protein
MTAGIESNTLTRSEIMSQNLNISAQKQCFQPPWATIVFKKIFTRSGGIQRNPTLIVMIVAALVLLPCAAQAAATLTNSASSSNNGSVTTDTLTFGWTATSGRLLVLAASWDKDVDSLSENSGEWTQVDYVIESTDSTTCAMYYKVA